MVSHQPTHTTPDGLHHHHVHPPAAGIIPTPHGPETGTDHASYPYTRNAANEQAILDYLLKPDDSYTSEGVYWADLPIWQRAKFVAATDAEEAAKELRAFGEMIKEDPLSPVGWYFSNAVLPGAGLGLEGYVWRS
jgi:hypothetical protein